MDKCAALSNLLQNKPDKLSFSVLSCGKIKVAGMDDLFTLDEVRMMLKTRFNWREGSINEFVAELEQTKEASAPVDAAMIPNMEKTAENTAVVVDMYEVDYSPVTEGASTQAIDKHFDAVNDFVSRMTFPDTTVSDIVVGPKEQIFKKKTQTPTRPDLPQNMNVPTRARASIWTRASEDGVCPVCKNDLNPMGKCVHCEPTKKQGSNDKCPECGSTEFGWMPPDFETAKCSKCEKTWQGKNPPLPPKSADDSFVSLLDEGLKDEVQGAAYWNKVAVQLHQKGDEENAKKASEHKGQENNHHAFLEELRSKYTTTKESSWRKLADAFIAPQLKPRFYQVVTGSGNNIQHLYVSVTAPSRTQGERILKEKFGLSSEWTMLQWVPAKLDMEL